MSIQALILTKIKDERARQDEKWGVQQHSLQTWMTILGEEYGEACRAVCEFTFAKTQEREDSEVLELKRELVRVAAVCVAALKQLETIGPYPFQTEVKRE